jgi:hypothetical protein
LPSIGPMLSCPWPLLAGSRATATLAAIQRVTGLPPWAILAHRSFPTSRTSTYEGEDTDRGRRIAPATPRVACCRSAASAEAGAANSAGSRVCYALSVVL